jgi:hypothetical protein
MGLLVGAVQGLPKAGRHDHQQDPCRAKHQSAIAKHQQYEMVIYLADRIHDSKRNARDYLRRCRLPSSSRVNDRPSPRLELR